MLSPGGLACGDCHGGGGRAAEGAQRHDVDYRYTVGGTVYAGEIYGTVDSTKQVGTTFPVKYDPAAPEHSNHVLSPSVPNLIIGVAGALFFILFALVMTGVVKLNRRTSSV